MKKGKKPQHFIQKPNYKGGPKVMLAFITKSLKYPEEAFLAKTEGTVRLRIRINHKGQIDHTTIIAGIGSGCDEEAQRVAQLLKFQVPSNRGVRAHFHKTLNFHFRYPANNKKSPDQVLQYTITKNNERKEDIPLKEKSGYDYSIDLG